MVRGEPSGYRLPFESDDKIRMGQGWNTKYSHHGRSAYAYDFGLHPGTPVVAAASGVVTYAHAGETLCGGPELLNNANLVTIDHPDGSATQYGHLATVDVEVGDVVGAGQVIGKSGMTGYTGCRPHLHFARQAQGGPVTDSVPIYFEGYEDSEFVSGDLIKASPATCASREKPPMEGFCGMYRSLATNEDAETVRAAGPDKAPGSDEGAETAETAAPLLFARIDKAIDFNWKKQAPGGYWLDDATTGFEATWAGRTKVAHEGVYSVDVRTTDRVRVLIDGKLVIDRWKDHRRAREFSELVRLESGKHTIEVQQVNEDGAGVLQLTLKPFLLEGPSRRRSEVVTGQ